MVELANAAMNLLAAARSARGPCSTTDGLGQGCVHTQRIRIRLAVSAPTETVRKLLEAPSPCEMAATKPPEARSMREHEKSAEAGLTVGGVGGSGTGSVDQPECATRRHRPAVRVNKGS